MWLFISVKRETDVSIERYITQKLKERSIEKDGNGNRKKLNFATQRESEERERETEREREGGRERKERKNQVTYIEGKE